MSNAKAVATTPLESTLAQRVLILENNANYKANRNTDFEKLILQMLYHPLVLYIFATFSPNYFYTCDTFIICHNNTWLLL